MEFECNRLISAVSPLNGSDSLGFVCYKSMVLPD